jgi:hypothetical protein
MNAVMILIIGFVAGCVIASGVWAVLVVISNKGRHPDTSGAETRKEIASECAEIENSIVSEGMKKMSKADFQSAVSPRLEKITKKLSSHLDSFDVYYVKYIESLIAKYRSALIPTVSVDPMPLEKKTILEPVSKEFEISQPSEGKTQKKTSDLLLEPEHFDHTRPMDFSKISQDRARFEKNPGILIQKEKDIELSPIESSTEFQERATTTPEETLPLYEPPASEKTEDILFNRLASDGEMKDTKIIQTENITEEKQSEIEKIIMAELSREPVDNPSKKPEPEVAGKKIAASPAPAIEYPKHIEKTIQPEEPPVKTTKEPPSPATPAPKDENFISGEDLVAKLDSFFGIQD